MLPSEVTKAKIAKRRRPVPPPSQVKDTKGNADRAPQRVVQAGHEAKDTKGNADRAPQRIAAAISNSKPIAVKVHHGFDPVHTATHIIHVVYGGNGNGPAGSHLAASRGGLGGALAVNSAGLQAQAVGLATLSDPKGVATKTAKGLRDTVAGTPGGLYHLVTTRPDHTLADISKDYERRYNGSLKSRIARIKKEGAAPELTDALGAVGGTGEILGRIAKIPGVAETRFGRVVTAERPNLRTSGGTSKAQDASGNYFGAAAQRKLDKARASKNAKEVQRAVVNGDTGDALRMTAHAKGEVSPLRTGKAAKEQRVAVAKGKSRAVHALRSEQGHRVTATAGRALNRLTRPERRAFYYVAAGLVPANAADAIAHLDKRMSDIAAARHHEGMPAPTGQFKKVDELANLQWLRDHAHEAFTPKLGDTVRQLRKQDVHVAAADPRFTARTALMRRYAQQAEHLGLRKGEVPVEPTTEMQRTGGKSYAIKHPRSAEAVQALHDWETEHPELLRISNKDAGLTAEESALLRHDAELRRAAYPEEHLSVGQYKPVTHPPSMRYDPNEGDAAFVRRVRAAADHHGLERPIYFHSTRFTGEPGHGDFAVGGTKAMREPFQYKGKNFALGLQDTRPEVYLQGLARSVKAKHNWKLVADQFDAHAFDGLKNLTVSQLRHELATRNIDPRTVAFWSPGKYRKLVGAHADDAENLADHSGIAEAVKHSTAESLTGASQYVNARWSVLPRGAYDEIHAGLAKDNSLHKYGRVWDITKEKQSRILLGAGNLPWLQFQILSNVGLSALATKGEAVIDQVRGQRWYHNLGQEDQQRVDSIIGGGMGHDQSWQTHLGAAADNKLIQAYRSFKAAPFWDAGVSVAGRKATIRKLNPIEAMFKTDAAQNRHFRRAVLYNQLKRQKFEDMGKNIAGAMSLQDRMFGSDAQATRALRDPALAEKHAQYVDNWLGDYESYTHRERATLRRSVMFYGFLRHSLKLVFYTLPVHHPVLTSIVARLGQLQANETRELLGADDPYVPGGADFQLGKVYFGDKAIDMSRANPALNAITSLHTPSQLFGLLPPLAGEAVDQLASKSMFKDKPWNVEGKTAPHNPGFGDYGLTDRARIAIDDTLSMAAPYRYAKDMKLSGPQGDDSLLWSPRPLSFSKRTKEGRQLNKNIDKSKAFESKTDTPVHELFPLVPTPQRDAQSSADEKKYAKLKNTKAKKKHHKRSYGFGGAGYGKATSGAGYGGGGFGK